MKKYVIIGASAAGLSCAQTIRQNDANGEITMITNEAFAPYSRPLISYYLKGRVVPENMGLRDDKFYAENKIDLVTSSPATEIDRKAKTVSAGGKKYSYDKLFIATGSKPFVPPVEGADGKENTFTFLSLADAEEIKSYASENTDAVVIGAGLIGLKAAEGLSKICKSVTVVELATRVLPSILDDDASPMVRKNISEHGIKTILGDTVTNANGDKLVESVTLKSGETLPCNMLVFAVGVRPQTDLAKNCGLKVGRGIVTDPETMATSDSDIYSAGDCAESIDMLDDSRKIIALWPNAVKGGKIAGSQMSGGNDKNDGSFSVNAIDFFGQRICTCGLINVTAPEYESRVFTDGDVYKRLIIRGNNLVGFVLINCSDRAGIYTSIIHDKVDITKLHGDLLDAPRLLFFDKAVRRYKLTGGVLK